HRRRTRRVFLRAPLEAPAVAVQRQQVGTVAPMHRHAPTPGDVADDLVARHRVAAAGKPDQHVVDAFDDDTVPHRLAGRSGGAVFALALAQLTPQLLQLLAAQQARQHLRYRQLAETDAGVHVVDVRETVPLGYLMHALGPEHLRRI